MSYDFKRLRDVRRPPWRGVLVEGNNGINYPGEESWGRAEEAASAKVLRQERVWHFGARIQRLA